MTSIFEKEPLEIISKKKQLIAYKHEASWHCGYFKGQIFN